MKRILAILCMVIGGSGYVADDALAQKGAGLGRGLSRAANATAAAGRGAASSSEAVSRAAGPLNAGVPATAAGVPGPGRGANGLQRAALARGTALPAAAASRLGGQPQSNQARITQHRLQQAEHLRMLSQQNGNEALLATADRMEASALQNQQRWQTQAEAGEAVPANEMAAGVVAPTVRPRSESKRGFWFRSR